MLITKEGNKEDINSILLKNDDMVILDENQHFEFTDTGKTLRLWEQKENKRLVMVDQWRASSLVALYKFKGEVQK